MISVQNISEDNYAIHIQPNSSLTGNYRIFFILSIALVCLGIATVFYFVGATLILPFAGLEISILIFAFYLNFNWSSKREKIYISQEKVTIENGIHKAEYRWEEFRTFTSFQVTKDVSKSLKLSFRSKGEDIEVGAFLNEDDKNILKEEVSSIINSLNA